MTAALNDTEKAKVAELTGLGLPEAAAIVSATSMTAGPNPSGGAPCRLFGKMKIKADGNVDEVKAALTAYGTASRAAPGNIGCDYSIANGELIMFEIFDSPNAMHIHVGHCFPHYVKMLPHVEMDTLLATCDPAQHEFWNTVCNSWGAKTAGAFPAL